MHITDITELFLTTVSSTPIQGGQSGENDPNFEDAFLSIQNETEASETPPFTVQAPQDSTSTVTEDSPPAPLVMKTFQTDQTLPKSDFETIRYDTTTPHFIPSSEDVYPIKERMLNEGDVSSEIDDLMASMPSLPKEKRADITLPEHHIPADQPNQRALPVSLDAAGKKQDKVLTSNETTQSAPRESKAPEGIYKDIPTNPTKAPEPAQPLTASHSINTENFIETSADPNMPASLGKKAELAVSEEYLKMQPPSPSSPADITAPISKPADVIDIELPQRPMTSKIDTVLPNVDVPLANINQIEPKGHEKSAQANLPLEPVLENDSTPNKAVPKPDVIIPTSTPVSAAPAEPKAQASQAEPSGVTISQSQKAPALSETLAVPIGNSKRTPPIPTPAFDQHANMQSSVTKYEVTAESKEADHSLPKGDPISNLRIEAAQPPSLNGIDAKVSVASETLKISGDQEGMVLIDDPLSAPLPTQPHSARGEIVLRDIAQPSAPDHGARAAQQIAVAMGMSQDGQIELRLDPEELGSVRVSLTPTDGTMSVHMSAERVETLDLLRRYADVLVRELRDIGYDDVNLRFGSNTSSQNGQDQRQVNDDNTTQSDVSVSGFNTETKPQTSQHSAGRSGGLDLRI